MTTSFTHPPDGEQEGSSAGEQTRQQLMLAAERLLGRLPIEQVSLLAVGREAGQANKSVVQYHFGSLDALVAALLDQRIAWLEGRREDLLNAAEASGAPLSVRRLLEIALQPIGEIVDEDGRYSFARFLLQWSVQGETWIGVVHPLLRANANDAGMKRIFRHVRALATHVERRLLARRMLWCTQTYLVGLIEHDDGVSARLGRARELSDVLDFCVAGLLAPPTRGLGLI